MYKKSNKKIGILVIFAAFTAISMSFVSWLIYAVFADNYRDIKQQYYAVVSKQIVEDIENSVKNGKTIERFYGMDNVLNEMLSLISTESVPVKTAVTDAEGGILYSSYAADANRNAYNAIISSENVRLNIAFSADNTAYKVVESDSYEVMLQPIFDSHDTQIGALTLFYRSEDIDTELVEQKQSSSEATMFCIAGVIIVLLVYFLFLPRSVTEDSNSEDGAEKEKHRTRKNIFAFVIPVVTIVAGLITQCVLSYNEYQTRYRDVMFEGAAGISEYFGGIMTDLRNKGVSYARMNGLTEYLAAKVEESPLLWNISVENVYADTSELLSHDSEYNIYYDLESDGINHVRINIEISKSYIDEKMMDMLLVFAVTFVVALIMIYELLKLPDILFMRLSKSYKTSPAEQAHSTAAAVRLGAFIAYTGMYVGIPFSSILINQWNKSIFGLSVAFLASIPMTAELLAIMLGSLFLLPLYKRLNLKAVFIFSALISVAANVLCFFANSPEQLIIYRFVSGIGFAGIKYALNTIVSGGSLSEEDTTGNLAALNAGLLGGITCGGTLGAVIASAISVQMSYLIAGLLIAVFLIAIVGLSPWKLVADNLSKEKGSRQKQKNPLSVLFNPGILRYMLLVAVPLNFGLMFVVAMFPSLVSSMGLPDVTISYGYLINGLVGIYIGPQMLKALSKRIGKTACVFVALLLAAGSVLLLNIDLPLIIVLASVAILGLFDGFGTPAASDYYVSLPVVKSIGVSQGLSVLSVIGSIVQTFSPMLYSIILASGLYGVNILGAVFTVCAVLFLVTAGLAQIGRKNDRDGQNSEKSAIM